MKKKKETRGGAREGAGLKPKYGEDTAMFSARVPVSHKAKVKALVDAYLAKVLKATKR